MDASDFEESDFYRALQDSGARVLLIGRMAMVLRGLPVATHDYDLWIDGDDIERLNAALARLDHYPRSTPDEARSRGRYVLENGEHIDVLVARAVTSKLGETVRFDEVWTRRETIEFAAGVSVAIPSIADHIRTKQWAMRAKDIGDIQLLEALAKEEEA